ncbi:synaptogyrin-4 [Rhinatrema bivittatum]|uniref:synaptogyrin-4 n=1 Tax=Rhinatrema bivittatum TaxID=194408 RepID=UPI0011273C61|nr:synaptogyrin-4 [Rhinatrema bivittatum]XP_029440622.1 synaptogyrin-4 [Rhinatrema bivittatum]
MAFFSPLQWLLMNKVFLFMTKPLTLTRTVAWIFALVVSGTLVSEGYQNTPWSPTLRCVLNNNPLACGFGIGLGLLSFLICAIFLGFDVAETHITKARVYKAIVITDLVVSLLCSLLWFIGFCFLAHQWVLSDSHHYILGSSAARISLTFSFFSIPCWGMLVYLAIQRLQSSPDLLYARSLDDRGCSNTELGQLYFTESVDFHASPNGGTVPGRNNSLPRN